MSDRSEQEMPPLGVSWLHLPGLPQLYTRFGVRPISRVGLPQRGVPARGPGMEVLPAPFPLAPRSYLEQRYAAMVRTQATAEMTQPT